MIRLDFFSKQNQKFQNKKLLKEKAIDLRI